MKPVEAFTVSENTPILALLIAKLPSKGRNKVKSLLTHRQVAVDGKIVTRHDRIVHPGQAVTILTMREPDKEMMRGVRILFEDEDLIVIDKPSGLLSMATKDERERTAYAVLTNYVRQLKPNNRIFIVHRLDRETSGVMMFAKKESVQQSLQEAWKDVVQERAYIALVEGVVTKSEGKLTSWLQQSRTQTMYVGKPGEGLKAVLTYRVQKVGLDCSLLEIKLETGRKNQIRVQMQSIGHPLMGDKRYGSKSNRLGRLGLHARILAFVHPVTGETMRFETPIPPDFLRVFSDKLFKRKGE